jgi:hypothetical protein
MTVSVVLRIADAALAAGRLAGEAELVATGERAVVKDADDLLAFVRRPRGELQGETGDGNQESGGG